MFNAADHITLDSEVLVDKKQGSYAHQGCIYLIKNI